MSTVCALSSSPFCTRRCFIYYTELPDEVNIIAWMRVILHYLLPFCRGDILAPFGQSTAALPFLLRSSLQREPPLGDCSIQL